MNHTSGESVLLAALMIALFLAALSLASYLASRQPVIPGAGQGDYVAEVWLEWEVCTGSTMYRERFPTGALAEQAVRRAAQRLDNLLPTHYPAKDWRGARYSEPYGFGILFCVRPLAPSERDHFTPVWTTVLPGHEEHRGEPAVCHPLAAEHLKLKGTGLAGVKL